MPDDLNPDLLDQLARVYAWAALDRLFAEMDAAVDSEVGEKPLRDRSSGLRDV